MGSEQRPGDPCREACERIVADFYPRCEDCPNGEKRATHVKTAGVPDYYCDEHAEIAREYRQKLISKRCDPGGEIEPYEPPEPVRLAAEALDTARLQDLQALGVRPSDPQPAPNVLRELWPVVSAHLDDIEYLVTAREPHMRKHVMQELVKLRKLLTPR